MSVALSVLSICTAMVLVLTVWWATNRFNQFSRNEMWMRDTLSAQAEKISDLERIVGHHEYRLDVHSCRIDLRAQTLTKEEALAKYPDSIIFWNAVEKYDLPK